MNDKDGNHFDVNTSLPWFPDGLPWWRRLICLLDYHTYQDNGKGWRKTCKYCQGGE